MTSNEELGYKALDVAMEILREFQKENPDLTKQEQNYIVESAEKAWLTLAIALGSYIAGMLTALHIFKGITKLPFSRG